jgi:SAM-dependent methyltransferase
MKVTAVPDDAKICFQCNICDHVNHVLLAFLERDNPSCAKCHSSVRLRAIMQALTTELFGESLRISQIYPRRPQVSGLGLSCWDGYAIPLSRALGFTNTYFHQSPKLDIADVGSMAHPSQDFLIASDVFEHVDPPVQRAFDNAYKLLSPNGVFVFSVPFTHPGEKGVPALEHYPELFDYQVARENGSYMVRNTTRTGESQCFAAPVFHGGPGSTLELRVFSESSIIDAMLQAGFSEIAIYSGNEPRHGIHWTGKWSVPIVARMSPGGSPKLSCEQRPQRFRRLLAAARRRMG